MNAQSTKAAVFERPNLDASIDVDAYLRGCPASATTRGTFFQFVVDFIQKEKGSLPAELFEGVAGRRWISWSNYPLADFMRLAVNASRIAYPKESLGQGLRQLGWKAYPSFAATMAGRVVIYAFGDDVEALMQALPRAYSVSLSNASARVRRLGPGHWEVELRDAYNFPDCYHLGVMEGAVRTRGLTPEVRIRRCPRRCDLDYELRW